MNLTNDSYVIVISTKNWTERYFRDENGWAKVSTRGREFRATAEQVLIENLERILAAAPRDAGVVR